MVHGHIALGGGLKFISSHPGTSLKDLSMLVYQQRESVQTSCSARYGLAHYDHIVYAVRTTN